MLKFKVDAGYDFPLQESLTTINRGLSQKSIPDLSELLSKVFLVMCKVCIATHKERIGVEASLEDYERGIEKQRQQIELYNDEIDRLFEIKEEAARYQEAQTLRNYAAAIEKTGNDGSQGKAEWIKRKADWIDPLKPDYDQVLGRLEQDKYPPEKKPLPSMRLPYEIDRFFSRRGRYQDSSWDDFIRLVE